MSAVDVTLLATGFGYHQTALLAAATKGFPGPLLTGARLGAITIGYPDLFLAAVLGASVAGTRDQWRAGALLTVLAIGLDSLLTGRILLPATVPIAITALVVLCFSPAWRRRREGELVPASTDRRCPSLRVPGQWCSPGAIGDAGGCACTISERSRVALVGRDARRSPRRRWSIR
jgi:hypothetical protein